MLKTCIMCWNTKCINWNQIHTYVSMCALFEFKSFYSFNPIVSSQSKRNVCRSLISNKGVYFQFNLPIQFEALYSLTHTHTQSIMRLLSCIVELTHKNHINNLFNFTLLFFLFAFNQYKYLCMKQYYTYESRQMLYILHVRYVIIFSFDGIARSIHTPHTQTVIQKYDGSSLLFLYINTSKY